MKKVISLFLLVLMIFCVFTACEKVNETYVSTSSKPPVALANLASSGKITEMQFGIGANVDEVLAYYNAQYESDPYAAEVLVYETREYTKIDLGAFAYYYETENKEGGIVGVTSVEKAYGFTAGLTTLEEVKNSMPNDAAETLVTKDDIFFLLGAEPDGAKKIYINTGDYELKLIFFNGKLSAVSLFK